MSIVAQLVNNLLVSKKLSGALVEYRAIQPICCTFPFSRLEELLRIRLTALTSRSCIGGSFVQDCSAGMRQAA